MKAAEVKQLAKQHGPTVAIAAVAVAAIRLGNPSSTAPPSPPSSLQLTAARVVAGEPALPTAATRVRPRLEDGIETRLVSCGGRGASIAGDGTHSTDDIGTVALGEGGGNTCTIVFETQLAAPRHCAVDGGHVAKSLPTEIVIDQIDGAFFAYRCEP